MRGKLFAVVVVSSVVSLVYTVIRIVESNQHSIEGSFAWIADNAGALLRLLLLPTFFISLLVVTVGMMTYAASMSLWRLAGKVGALLLGFSAAYYLTFLL